MNIHEARAGAGSSTFIFCTSVGIWVFVCDLCTCTGARPLIHACKDKADAERWLGRHEHDDRGGEDAPVREPRRPAPKPAGAHQYATHT